MTLAAIREQIDELSYAERVELSEWLQMTTPPEEQEDSAWLQETEALAEQRSEELRLGKARALTEQEFWVAADAAKQQRRNG